MSGASPFDPEAAISGFSARPNPGTSESNQLLPPPRPRTKRSSTFGSKDAEVTPPSTSTGSSTTSAGATPRAATRALGLKRVTKTERAETTRSHVGHDAGVTPARRGRPRTKVSPVAVPFGTVRNHRISYGVNLTPQMNSKIEALQRSGPTKGIPAGAIAVEAIRTTWKQIADQLTPEGTGDDLFPPSRMSAAFSRQSGATIRKVFYISLAEATAIETVRASLGNVEIGQLHRLAFQRYFDL